MDWANWSTARKILLPASLLLLIDSFLNWNEVCVDIGPSDVCGGGFNAWHGIGFLMGLLALALLAWEAIDTFAPDTLRNSNLPMGLIAAALALATAVFAVIRFLQYDGRTIWAWIGLILAIVIAYGGWLRYRESDDKLPSRSSTGSGAATGSGGAGTSAGSTSGTTTGGAGESGTMGSTGGMGSSPSAGTSGTTGGAGTTGGSDLGGGSGGTGGSSSGSREETPPA